jgi:oligopeptide transport system substrate-binding protein
MRAKLFAVASLLIVVAMILPACSAPAPAQPQVVEKVVTQVVEKQVEKQVVQTQVVEKEKQVVVTATPAPKAAGPKVLRWTVGTPGDIPTLDPGLGEDTHSIQWVNMTNVGLTYLNEENTQIKPGIAEKWDISQDGKVYTFTLRTDVPWVKWDNSKGTVTKVQGCPDKDNKTTDRIVTANDFEYGILRALDPKTASPYAYVLSFVVKGADAYNSGKVTDTKTVGVKAIDPKTLRVEFLEPAAYNANIIGLWTAHAVPKWLIEGDDCTDARGERWTETGFFQGYGPYTLKEWVHDSNAVFVKNPFWPGSPDIPAAKIDELHDTFLDNAAAFSEYEAGNVDVTSPPLSEMDRIKSDPVLSKELHIAPQLCTYYYGFNTKAPVVDDVRVRRALSMAIDRQSLIDNVTKGNQEPAQWFCRPGLTGCPTIKDFPDLGVKFDVAKAKASLDEYLKEKGTTADKLDLTLMYNTSEGHKKIAEAIQQMWKQNLGVDVKVVNQEWKVYLNTTKDPKNTPQIWRLGWCQDYPDANNFDKETTGFGGNANPKEGGGFNWKNDKFEALITKAAAEQDSATRVKDYADAEQIIAWDDAIMAPIYWYTSVEMTKPNVQRTFSNTGHQEFNKWDMTAPAK